MKMVCLSYLIFTVFIILSFNVETQQKQVAVDHDDGDDLDWMKMKWDSILVDPDSDSSNTVSVDDSHEDDEMFISDFSDKQFKSNLKSSESELNTFSEDEVFLESNDSNKSSDSKTSAEAMNQKKQSDLDDSDSPNERNSDIQQENRVPENEHEFEESVDLKDESKPSDSSLEPENSHAVFDSTEDASDSEKSNTDLLSQRSFIFNPMAGAQEQFQNCTTPRNESGSCRYLQHCLIPTIVGSLNQFMDYVCIIEGRFIGVCCPHNPVTTVVVQDQNETGKGDSELNENCGVATNTRIVGGMNADPKAYPWMVALLSKSKKFFCGGSLINDRYVLTAAHCTFDIPKNEIIARVGEYDFKDDGKTHEEYAVVEMKRHGHYNRRTLANDIALLKLDKPVTFNQFVKTICFPEEENDYVGENATLTGWGNTAGGGSTSDVLQQATFPIITNDECSKIHGLPIPESLICSASLDKAKGGCNGDSGGPLMLLDKNDRWKVIGLVSWGRRGCSPEFPTVYTRVSHFLEWIEEHAK